MLALADIVRQGKALCIGISNYGPKETEEAAVILKELKVPFILHQARDSIFGRWVEGGLLDTLEDKGVGCIAFSPLAQGMLTNKYVNGIPEESRAAIFFTYLDKKQVEDNLQKIKNLAALAEKRGQKLSQMALLGF